MDFEMKKFIDNHVNTDLLLKDLGGCGLFQFLQVLFTSLSVLPLIFVFPLLTFGIYNPGWRCLDNITDINGNQTLFHNLTLLPGETILPNQTGEEPTFNQSAIIPPAPVYRTDTCQGFDSCRRVEFNPEASTLVTEWALVCSKAWVPNLILSLKMAGETVGQLAVGYIGDKFGRKLPYHCAIFVFLCLQLVAFFSVSWEMFAALCFLSALPSSFITLLQVLSNEVVPPLWRIRVSSLPTWTMGLVIYSLVVMFTKDWKTLLTIICACTAITFIPLFWVPESLRWLIAHGRKTQAKHVVDKIAKTNRAKPPSEATIDQFFKGQETSVKKVPTITMIHLFRRGYRIKTTVIGLAFFVMNLVYFALNFGVTKLPGDVYVNMIILAISELPANVVAIWLGNRFGRKRSAILFFEVEAVCLVCVALVDLFGPATVKDTTVIVLVVSSKAMLNVSWYTLVTGFLEMYPTIARVNITSFALLTANFGSIFAPYLIPSEPETLYLCYLVMGGVTLVCGLALCFIPETKGTQYQDTWKDIEVKEKRRENSQEANKVV